MLVSSSTKRTLRLSTTPTKQTVFTEFNSLRLSVLNNHDHELFTSSKRRQWSDKTKGADRPSTIGTTPLHRSWLFSLPMTNTPTTLEEMIDRRLIEELTKELTLIDSSGLDIERLLRGTSLMDAEKQLELRAINFHIEGAKASLKKYLMRTATIPKRGRRSQRGTTTSTMGISNSVPADAISH